MTDDEGGIDSIDRAQNEVRSTYQKNARNLYDIQSALSTARESCVIDHDARAGRVRVAAALIGLKMPMALRAFILAVALPCLFCTSTARAQGSMSAARARAATAGEVLLLHPGQEWVGSYVCLGHPTQLTLHIEEVGPDVVRTDIGPAMGVRAVFEFGKRSSPAHHGSFLLSGVYLLRERLLKMDPRGWLSQPKGHRMWGNRPVDYLQMGMIGTLSADGRRYRGNFIFGVDCGRFSLVR